MIRLLVAWLGLIGLAAPAIAQSIDTGRIDRLAVERGFAGVILISHGDELLYARAHGHIQPGVAERHRLDGRWRWASITKQIVAVLAMREVAAGRLDLDQPVSRYWPDFPNADRDALTARHLLRHVSGLPDPEDSPRLPNGLIEFYAVDGRLDTSATGYCAGPSDTPPGTRYRYSNCDFIVLGALLERVSGNSLPELVSGLFDGSQTMSPDGEPIVRGFHHGQAEPLIRYASHGSAGAINGTIMDLWQFDRALMRGELMPAELRDEMWTGDPAIGYTALGQWVFPVELPGCQTSQRLVERPGAILSVQGRNYILPERDMAVIVFTNRSESEFPLGHIAFDNGFAFDLLSAAACSSAGE